MTDMQEAEATLVQQLVETDAPAEVTLIDKKLAVLAKHKQ